MRFVTLTEEVPGPHGNNKIGEIGIADFNDFIPFEEFDCVLVRVVFNNGNEQYINKDFLK